MRKQNGTVTIRAALVQDLDAIMPILEQARAFQINCGHPQWEKGYPSREKILEDISCQGARLVVVDGETAGYFAMISRDAGYDCMKGLWDKPLAPYIAVHRLALSDSFRGKGLTSLIFKNIFDSARQCGAEEIRIDTGLDNLPMHHSMAKLGFKSLGNVVFPWGPRVAYVKKL